MIALRAITKSFSEPAGRHMVLNGIDLDVGDGESIAILGRSGSGKSTLLSLLALFDSPDSGTYRLDEQDVSTLREVDRCRLRQSLFGFVFQRFFLLKHLTAAQNVEAALLCGRSPQRRVRKEAVMAALEKVGIAELAHRRPPELSGGEQQRVAIARALVNTPKVLLADEPTGALDAAVGDDLLRMLIQLTGQGTTLVMVTHDQEYASRLDRVVRLQAGKLT